MSVRESLDSVNEVGRHSLNVGSTIPWAGFLDRIKRRKGAGHQQLFVPAEYDRPRPVAAVTFPTMINHTLELLAQSKKLFPSWVALVGCFFAAIKRNWR